MRNSCRKVLSIVCAISLLLSSVPFYAYSEGEQTPSELLTEQENALPESTQEVILPEEAEIENVTIQQVVQANYVIDIPQVLNKTTWSLKEDKEARREHVVRIKAERDIDLFFLLTTDSDAEAVISTEENESRKKFTRTDESEIAAIAGESGSHYVLKGVHIEADGSRLIRIRSNTPVKFRMQVMTGSAWQKLNEVRSEEETAEAVEETTPEAEKPEEVPPQEPANKEDREESVEIADTPVENKDLSVENEEPADEKQEAPAEEIQEVPVQEPAEEETDEEPVENTDVENTDIPVENEEPVEEPADEKQEDPVDETQEEPVQESAEEETNEEPVENLDVENTDLPVDNEEPADENHEKPVEETQEEPAQESAEEETDEEPVENLDVENTDLPVDNEEPAEEPADEQQEALAEETQEEPVQESAEEETDEEPVENPDVKNTDLPVENDEPADENKEEPAEENQEEPAEEAEAEPEEDEFWEAVISEHIDDYTVTVTIPKEAEFPIGTTVKITPLNSAEYRNDAAGIFDKNENELGTFIRVFDITFYYEDMEIEPLVPIDVKITFDNAVQLEGENELKLIHLHEEEEAREIVVEAQTTEVETGEGESEGEENTQTVTNVESLSFQSGQFSTYIVAEEVVVYTFTDSGKDYEVILKYNAGANIPEDAVFSVEEITEDSALYEQYRAQVAAVINPDGSVRMPALLDISLKRENGEKIQLGNKVQVIVRLTGEESLEKSLKVVHFPGEDPFQGESAVREVVAENGEYAEIEVLDIESEKLYARVNTEENTVSFNTDSFSVFALAYTVDFYYGEYEYHLEGNGEMLLSELFTLLGIERDAADVVRAVFTDPSLLQVEKTENDWRLTSLLPFDTEETLTLYFRNGDMILLRVEDSRNAFKIIVNDTGGGSILSDSDDMEPITNQTFVAGYGSSTEEQNSPAIYRNFTAHTTNSDWRFVFWLAVYPDKSTEIFYGNTLPASTRTREGGTTTFIACFAPSNAKLIVIVDKNVSYIGYTGMDIAVLLTVGAVRFFYCEGYDREFSFNATQNAYNGGGLFRGWYEGNTLFWPNQLYNNEYAADNLDLQDVVLTPVYGNVFVSKIKFFDINATINEATDDSTMHITGTLAAPTLTKHYYLLAVLKNNAGNELGWAVSPVALNGNAVTTTGFYAFHPFDNSASLPYAAGNQVETSLYYTEDVLPAANQTYTYLKSNAVDHPETGYVSGGNFINNDGENEIHLKAAPTGSYQAVIQFRDKTGNVVQPSGVSGTYKVYGAITKDDHVYGAVTSGFDISSTSSFSENNTVIQTIDQFYRDNYADHGSITCTDSDDVEVKIVRDGARLEENSGALQDPYKALEIGDAIGSYALTTITVDKPNAKTTLVFQEVDPYIYTVTTSDSTAIAFDNTADSNWYILSVLKKADGTRTFHYAAPVILQEQTSVTGTIPTYYANSDPSKIAISNPGNDTDTRSSVYVEGDTVSTVLIHMNNQANTYKDVLQLEENGNVKGEMYGDGSGANCYTLHVQNISGASTLTLTKAVNPTITLEFQDAAGVPKAPVLTSDNYYLYVELERGRGEDSYGYVTGKLDLTQTTQTFTIPYFHAGNRDTKHNVAIDGTTRHAYLTDGNSYTVYLVQRNDSAPTVDWCKNGTGVVLYDNSDQIERTILDTTAARNITAPYTTTADEMNGTVIIKEMPVLSIRTEFKTNNVAETAPITLTGHRYDLLVSMTDANGNTYYRLMPLDTTTNPSAAASIQSFTTANDDGKLYYYTGTETISIALVQTIGNTAPGLHNAIYGEGGCLVFENGMVSSDGYTVSSTSSGNVITTTLEKKEAAPTAFTTNIEFFSKKNGSRLTTLSPELSGNYYLLATLNTGTEETSYKPVAYKIVSVTEEQLNTANTTGEFFIYLPDSTAYSIVDANGHEAGNSSLSFDPALFTMSVRLYNTTGSIPTTYTAARAGNDAVNGYDFWQNLLSSDGESANISLYSAYRKKYQIQLNFSEPMTINSDDALHIRIEAKHSTTGTDIFETDITGSELSSWLHVIEDQTGPSLIQHWSTYGQEGNIFSGNEKITITLSRKGNDIGQGGRAYDYIVNYEPDPRRTEVNDDDNKITTITDYVELTKIHSSYDYNFYSILGDGVAYGITADYLYQNGHIQSNFAANFYYGNNIIEPDLAGHGAVIVVADFALKEGKALEIGGSHVEGTDTVIYLGNGGTLDLVRNVSDRPWIHVVPSSTEDLTNNVVNPIIHHMQTISAELSTHETTIHPTPNGEGKMYIDLLDFPSDATIYLDGDELSFWIAKGKDGLYIKKHKNQTIVFNYDSTNSATIGQYHVMYADGEDDRFNPTTGNYFSSYSPTGKNNIDNIFADELAKHIVYNLRGVKNIKADTIVGMVLIPRADSTMEITGTSAGWVISAGYVTNTGAEWHSVYADMPDSSTTDLTIFKTMDAEGRTPSAHQVFTFNLEHLITTGGTHSWHLMGSQNNSSRTVKFAGISEMETGWNVYKITESSTIPSQTVGSYVLDQRSIYAFVRYFTIGGRVMVAGMPRYFMEMDENDAPAVKEFTFDEAAFNPARETLREAVGENAAGIDLKAVTIPTFNNTTRRDGLEISKIVTGTNNPNARFNFMIEIWQNTNDEDTVRIFEDTSTTERDYPISGVDGQTEITFRKVNDPTKGDEYAVAYLTLKAGQTARIVGIPVGASYRVTELTTVADITDETRNNEVPFDAITGMSNGYTQSATGETGVIIQDAVKRAIFTNNYHAMGEYIIDATKTMLGRPMQANEFFFVVEKNGETKLTGVSQAANTGAGADIIWIPDSKLTFTQDDIGTHTYIFREDTSRLNNGVAVAGEAEFEIRLRVADNHDGTLTVTRVDANNPTIAFTNTLRTEVTLEGTKTLVGRDMAAGETFNFIVTEHVGDDDAVVATGTATGPSNENEPLNIVFTPVTYLFDGDATHYPKTHTYTITEDEDGLGNGVTNTTGCSFTATVTENYDAESGTFSASEPVYTPSSVAFVNTWEYEKKSIRVTKEWYMRPMAGGDPVRQAVGAEKTFQLYRTTGTIPVPANGSAYTPAEITALAAGNTVEIFGSPFMLGGTNPYSYSNNQLPKYDTEDNEYYYFVVETDADDTEYVFAEQTIGEAPNTTIQDTWTVRNYMEETTILNVEKKWQDANGTEITNSQETVGSIQYELWQSESTVNTPKPAASTVSVIDGGVTYGITGWNESTTYATINAPSSIKTGSTIKISVNSDKNAFVNLGNLKINGNSFTPSEGTGMNPGYLIGANNGVGCSASQVLENVNNNITISGALEGTERDNNLTITVTVISEPAEVSGGTGGDPTSSTEFHKVGTVTLTKNTASITLESAFQGKGITIDHGIEVWSSVIENLPVHNEEVTASETITTDYTYYVQEIVPSGASYRSLSVSPDTSVAPNGSTIVLTNRFNETPTSTVRVTKAFVGLNSADFPAGFQIVNDYNEAAFGLNAENGKIAPSGGNGTEADPYYWEISDLPIGTVVTFTETGYDVAGYIVVTEKKSSTDDDFIRVTSGDRQASATSTQGTTDMAAFRNTYNLGVELPSTGGVGTTVYTVAGLAMALLAGIFLLMGRKRKVDG